MRERSALSGSGLFLIELLFGLMIFAVTAAICVEIFVGSHMISNDTNRLNQAVTRVQSGAELFQATNGDLEEVATLLDGNLVDANTVSAYFDYDWNRIASADRDVMRGYYSMYLRRVSEGNGYISGDVAISDNLGNLIFAVPIAVLEVTP